MNINIYYKSILMNKEAIIILIGTLMILAVSCKQDNSSTQTKNLSTDLINIPVGADGVTDTTMLPVFEFETDTYDFGVITQGEKVSFSYRFKNSGKTDLIITSAKGSCGCTVPEYPKRPIPPGGEEKIQVVFDSDGKSGRQNKTVTILANTYPSTTALTVTGEIKAPGMEE